jgi:hypothetical protein
MLHRDLKLSRYALCLPLIVAGGVSFATEASAHVKWFCAFNVAGQPRGLENVLCSDFELLTGFAILGLFAGYLLELTSIGEALLRALDRVTESVKANSDLLIRAGCGFFFIALWTLGGILLTPELKTTSAFIPWAQLGFAFCLLWQRTTVVSAAGIVLLFALALQSNGLFHLMDYPVFLGLAAYLALTSLKQNCFGIRPLDILRWSAAITLMWASIEKWAYPQWTFSLFITHPALTMGFDEEFFMRAAGVVEFTLSFGLLLTPLVRRCSALILLGMFTGAITEFGKLDAIGHAPIIVVLLAIFADNVPQELIFHKGSPVKLSSVWKYMGLIPASYGALLAVFLSIYYVMHSLMYGTTII